MTTDELRRQDGAVWADHFEEPHTGSLYRQDERGNWYDIEGVRLTVPVFLRGEVLVSLPGKVSRRSYAFRDQPLLVSPNLRLIQVGRLVYGPDLEPVRYFGDRLGGLGPKSIDFGGEDVWQEVLLGIDRRAFLNEFTGQPLVINNEEIIDHVGSHRFGTRRYEVFRSGTRRYVLVGSSDDLLRIGKVPAAVDFSTYVRFSDRELVAATVAGERYYVDLDDRRPFRLPALGDTPVVHVSKEPVAGHELFDMRTATESFVFDVDADDVYTLNEGSIRPECLHLLPALGNHLFGATVGGIVKICDRRTQRVLSFDDGNLEIAEITGVPGSRLLNARGTRGESVVLDAGDGLDRIRPAVSCDRRVTEVLDRPRRIGGLTLQHVLVHQLGGPVPRVLVVSDPDLPFFTLPTDLAAYADQATLSGFGGCEILSIDFEEPVTVEESAFYRARFLSFTDAEETVLLRTGNGRPLHLEGAGHRNELVTGFVQSTLNQEHRLGNHRMIGARTLTEDHKEGELLFSLENERSWLPFYDGFLPIFRRVVRPAVGEENWEYVLYELREAGGAGEYVAVEKAAPYRVLASRSGKQIVPKIINQKKRAVISPEEMSQWRKLFVDSGVLVEVI